MREFFEIDHPYMKIGTAYLHCNLSPRHITMAILSSGKGPFADIAVFNNQMLINISGRDDDDLPYYGIPMLYPSILDKAREYESFINNPLSWIHEGCKKGAAGLITEDFLCGNLLPIKGVNKMLLPAEIRKKKDNIYSYLINIYKR